MFLVHIFPQGTGTYYLKVFVGPIPHMKRWIVTTKRKVREDVNSCILIQLERENLAWVGNAKNTFPQQGGGGRVEKDCFSQISPKFHLLPPTKMEQLPAFPLS
jgi:hypothetical protein